MLLTLIKDDCYFGGVHIGLLTQCKICFTLGLLANYFSLNYQLAFPSKVRVLNRRRHPAIDRRLLWDL